MYFPLNKIKTGLVSNGELIVKNTGDRYFGPYFETYTNKFYAGESPDFSNLVELVQVEGDPLEITEEGADQEDDSQDLRFGTISHFDYSTSKNVDPNSKQPSLPKPGKSIPTDSQLKIGEYLRYFAKRTNENTYFEISSETYNKLSSQDPTILWSLYDYVSMPFSIYSSSTNIELAYKIEKQKNWAGFVSWLNIPLEVGALTEVSPVIATILMSKEGTQENLFTRGGEFVTKTGQNYIGPYHIHPTKGPMVGAIHVPSPHGYLYRIGQSTGSVTPPTTTTPTLDINYNMGSGASSPSTPSGGGGGYSGGGGGGY